MPDRKRWMMFVDGENFAIRFRKVAEAKGVQLYNGRYAQRDVFAWRTDQSQFDELTLMEGVKYGFCVEPRPIRAFYYTTAAGGDDALTHLCADSEPWQESSQS